MSDLRSAVESLQSEVLAELPDARIEVLLCRRHHRLSIVPEGSPSSSWGATPCSADPTGRCARSRSGRTGRRRSAGGRYRVLMCRSIKTLRRSEEPATDEEIRAAALQFVRKVSGYRKPSRANEEAFDKAVEEIAASSERLLQAMGAETVHDAAAR